jgi:hypothetical protein
MRDLERATAHVDAVLFRDAIDAKTRRKLESASIQLETIMTALLEDDTPIYPFPAR